MFAVQLAIGLIFAACLLAGIIYFAKHRQQKKSEASLAAARSLFSERREWLEADYWKLGANSGKPRGLEWENCDFDNDVQFARDKTNGTLTAFVGVSIKFSAIIGGDMEDVEAVNNEKAATAVFQFNGDKWEATGKTVFNLSPSQAIEYYQNELEFVP